MKLTDLTSTATLSSLAEAAIRNVSAMPSHDQHNTTSVREADYEGHHIVIRTRYQVEVDGASIDVDLHVDNNGHVHYHAIPNLDFESAIDLVKKLIDTFPDDFQSSGEGHTHDHSGGGHTHDMPGMPDA